MGMRVAGEGRDGVHGLRAGVPYMQWDRQAGVRALPANAGGSGQPLTMPHKAAINHSLAKSEPWVWQ